MTAYEALQTMSLDEFFDAMLKRAEKRVLLTYKEVSALTGLSAPTIRKLVNAGRFPKPVMGTGERGSDVRFLRSEIENLRRT